MKETIIIDIDNKAVKVYTTKKGLKKQMQVLKEVLGNETNQS